MIYWGPNYGTWKLIFEPTYFGGKYFSKKKSISWEISFIKYAIIEEDDNLNWGCIFVDTLSFSYLCLASVKCTHLIPGQGKGKNEKGDHRLLRVRRSRGGAGVVLRFSSCSNFQAGCSAFNYRRYFYPLSCNCHRALLSRHYCHALCFSFTMSANVIVVVVRIERKSLVNLLDAVFES